METAAPIVWTNIGPGLVIAYAGYRYVYAIGQYKIVRNPSLTGASFGAVGGSSTMNYDTAATSFTGGQVVDSGSFSIGSKEADFTTIGFSFSGSTGDILSLCVAGMNGRPVSVVASFRWTEES